MSEIGDRSVWIKDVVVGDQRVGLYVDRHADPPVFFARVGEIAVFDASAAKCIEYLRRTAVGQTLEWKDMIIVEASNGAVGFDIVHIRVRVSRKEIAWFDGKWVTGKGEVLRPYCGATRSDVGKCVWVYPYDRALWDDLQKMKAALAQLDVRIGTVVAHPGMIAWAVRVMEKHPLLARKKPVRKKPVRKKRSRGSKKEGT